MIGLASALAAFNQPEAYIAALERLVDATIGVKLFTLTAIDHDRGVAQRIYSGMPLPYPVSGEKPLTPDIWTETVIDRGQTFVANSIQEIAEVFPDHPLILSLGLESCLNLPVMIGGSVIGTLNCLNDAGHYTPARVKAAETLKLPGALAFLLAGQPTRDGDRNG